MKYKQLRKGENEQHFDLRALNCYCAILKCLDVARLTQDLTVHYA